ncbi:MAG: PAS domain-containing sensor histidine kinase [Elusimicrobia bacterium]|nr:PAS domain-containing sensor histidine kinase [Elusimicrobiota bacterium]
MTTISFDEIAELKVKLQAVLFSIEDGIVMTDFEGNISLINDRARKMLGVQKGYPYEKKFLEYVQDEWVKDKLSQLLETKDSISSTEIGIATDGGEIYLHTTKNIVTTAQGVVLGQVVVLHDVTTEKQFEKLKDDFVHSITHDLKSPLSSLLGFLKLFQDGELGALSPEQKRYLEIMSHSANDLLRMINDILDMSKLESGKMVLSKTNWDADAMVSHIVESLRGVAYQCKVQISHQYVSGEPSGDNHGHLYADKALVERVLNNLLDNALKFTPGGGAIEVQVRDLTQEIEFSVKDTGKGIPPESQSTIFEKFKQVPGTKSGSGLGLAISKYIVEAHGGRIALESQLSHGTKVFFTIPKSS